MKHVKFCFLKTLVLIIAFLTISSNMSLVYGNDNATKSIELRQLAMKGMWVRIKRIAPYIESTESIDYSLSDAEKDVGELVLLMDKVKDLWPNTSNLSNIGKTNANPAVWAVPEYFEKLYSRAQKSADELQQSIANNDDFNARSAICELGKSCGACHASFRRLLTSELADEASAWSGKYVKDCM